MQSPISEAQQYWDQRYRAEGMIWGEKPSATAEHALRLFSEHQVRTVLVPGAGYGRNTRLFSSAGLKVTGIEVSPVACALSQEYDPQTEVHQGLAFETELNLPIFDAIYCFNVLHLLRAAEREAFLDGAARHVVEGGWLFFTVFSEREPSLGQGREVEPFTFESKPGRPVHYFSDEDLRFHFAQFNVHETGIADDHEDHGDGPHNHVLRCIVAQCVK